MIIDEVLSLFGAGGSFSSIVPPQKDYFPRPRVNPFLIISDQYHKENLHTDIIKYLLDPQEDHGTDRFLRLFIEFLDNRWLLKKQGHAPNVVRMRASDFIEPQVDKNKSVGKGQVDIFIEGKGKDDKHNAIIIENKINNATDTDQQLLKYHKNLSKNYNVLRIVYLSLDGNKRPDISSWKCDKKDIDQVLDKTDYVAAFDNRQNNLVDGWLIKCLSDMAPSDINQFIIHYIELLKYRRGNLMNEEHLTTLFNFLKDDKQMAQVEYLIDLYNQVGQFRAAQFISRWERNEEQHQTPFHDIKPNGRFVIFDKFRFDDTFIKITVAFPPHKDNKEYRENIQFRVFTKNKVKMPSKIVAFITNTEFGFQKSQYDEGDFDIWLLKKESLPSNENVIFNKLIKLNKGLFDISHNA